MVLYKPLNKIFNNRLECKKILHINNSQYRKLMELELLIPINKEDDKLKSRKVEG